MRVIGRIITCMVKGHIHGRMEESIKVNTIMIRKMGMESIPGLMAKSTVEIGRKENNMVKASM